MKNLNKIKNTKNFKELTLKSPEYLDFLKTRIAPHITQDLASEMLAFSLSQKHLLKIAETIKKDCFLGKIPTKTPEINIILGQTGAGKSYISKSILNNTPNTIFIDTDSYKKYNPFKDLILKHCPTHFGTLTGLDSYLIRDIIYQKALEQKYNILIEVTPSSKEKLFNIDIAKLQNLGYKINAHFIARANINSLLSIHERYEQQLLTHHPTPKLTDLNRALDSCLAIEQILKELININNVNISIYQYNNTQKLIAKNKQNLLKIFKNAQNQDYLNSKQYIDTRINKIQELMQSRKAPKEQLQQFEKIKKIILKNC